MSTIHDRRRCSWVSREGSDLTRSISSSESASVVSAADAVEDWDDLPDEVLERIQSLRAFSDVTLASHATVTASHGT